MEKVLMYIGGFYLLTTLVSKGASATVQIGSISVSVLDTTPAGVTVEIHVPVINSLPVSATVSNLAANVWYGSNNLANINLYAPTTIAAGDTTILVLETFISFTDLASNLISIIQSGSYLSGLSVKGTVQAAGLNIPIDQPIHPI